MSMYKPAVPAPDEGGEKVKSVYKEVYRIFLDKDPFEILDIELNGSGSERWAGHKYVENQTRNWSEEERKKLAEEILRQTPLICINIGRMRIFKDYVRSESGELIPSGTETHDRCVSAPLGLSDDTSIRDFCELRGLDPSLADFQRYVWDHSKSWAEREQIDMNGLRALAEAAGVVVATYYYHNPDLSSGDVDYEVEGYYVYSPDGTIYKIVKDEQEGAERFTLELVATPAI